MLDGKVKNDLLQLITRKRKEMVRIADVRGIKNRETIKHSKELDVLIIRYQRYLLEMQVG